MPVGCAVLQRLKRLRRLQEVDLSPDEAWALLDRVQTNTSSAEDRERLAHLIRVTTAVTEQLRAAPVPEPEPPAPQRLSSERKAKRQRQLAKAARRRQRP
jgi:DNA-binding transcriptional MerR regulator